MMKGTNLNIVRYEKIVELREDGKTFQEIADLYDVSRQRIFQIYQRASKRIANRPMLGNRQASQTKAA